MNDETTVEKLVNENLKLAYWMVEKYASRLERWVDRDEITSNALLGLFDAAQVYDASKGFKFSNIAIVHIKKRILRPLVYMERKMRGGLNRNDLRLDEVDENGESIWHDRIADKQEGEPDESLSTENMKNIIAKVLPRLRPNYRLVVMFRLGLGGLPYKTFDEIKDYFGVTRSRIQQLDERAMAALRFLVAKEMETMKEVKE